MGSGGGVRWGRVGGLLGEQWQIFWVGGGVRGHVANVILITAATVGVLHCARAVALFLARISNNPAASNKFQLLAVLPFVLGPEPGA